MPRDGRRCILASMPFSDTITKSGRGRSPGRPLRPYRIVGGVGGGLFLLALLVIGDPREFARVHGAKQRLSVATGGTGGVWYPYGGGVAKVISAHVRSIEATAEVTAASVDNLKLLRNGSADIAFTMADALDDARRGRGAFRTFGRVRANALAVLYTNYTHVLTLADRGIDGIADLKGRAVSTGAPGSGTEAVAFRILEAAGLDPDRDIRRQGLGVGPSADALKDGKIDAFFWNGGVPTGAVLDLASTPGRTVRILPSDHVLPAMQREYGASLYYRVSIPKTAYPGLDADVPVVGVSNLLVVDERMSEQLAYEITRALFEHRDELVAIHPEARSLTLASAVAGSPVPFHPGAIRFYRERGAWKD